MAIAVQTLSFAGMTPTYSAALASDTVNIGNGGNTFLHVKNAGGSSVTVTVAVPGTDFAGNAIPDATITVPATTGDKMIALAIKEDDGTGNATVTTSAQTSVTWAAIRFP